MVLVNWMMMALLSLGLSPPRPIYAPTALDLLLFLKAFVSLLWAWAPAAVPSLRSLFPAVHLAKSSSFFMSPFWGHFLRLVFQFP